MGVVSATAGFDKQGPATVTVRNWHAHAPMPVCTAALCRLVPVPQKEKNHMIFDNALFHMRQMDFVPITAFPELCTAEVGGWAAAVPRSAVLCCAL